MKIFQGSRFVAFLFVLAVLLSLCYGMVVVTGWTPPWLLFVVFLLLFLCSGYEGLLYLRHGHEDPPYQKQKTKSNIRVIWFLILVCSLVDVFYIADFSFGVLPYNLSPVERFRASRVAKSYKRHSENKTLHLLDASFLLHPESASRYLPMTLYQNRRNPELQGYVVRILEEILEEPLLRPEGSKPLSGRAINRIGARTEAWRRRRRGNGRGAVAGGVEVDGRLSEVDRILREAEGNLEAVRKDMARLDAMAAAAVQQFMDSYHSARQEGRREEFVRELVQGGDEAATAGFYMMRMTRDPDIHELLFEVIHQIRGRESPDVSFPLSDEDMDRLEKEWFRD